MGRSFVFFLILFIFYISTALGNDSFTLEKMIKDKWLFPQEESGIALIGDSLWKQMLEEKVISFTAGRLQVLKDGKFFSAVRNYPDYTLRGLKIIYCKKDIQISPLKLVEGTQIVKMNYVLMTKNPWLDLPILAQDKKRCLLPFQEIEVTKKGNDLQIKR